MSLIILNPNLKRFYLLIVYPLVSVIYFFTIKLIKSKIQINPLIEWIFKCFSEIIILSLIFIEKKITKKSKLKIIIKSSNTKIGKKFYILFFLIIAIEFLYIIIDIILNLNNEISFLSLFISKYSMELILVELMSKYIFNSLSYIHNLISQILFIIFAIIIDIIISKNEKNFGELKFSHFLLFFMRLLFDSIIIIFAKYLLDFKYFSPIKVGFLFGFIDFICIIILISIGINFKYFLCYYDCCIDIKNMINEFFGINKIYIELLKTIPLCIIFSINIFILFFTIHYFSPSHIVIFNAILGIFNIFYDIHLGILSYFLISFLFILLLMSMLIYIEILELNFLGLNKNTKRSVMDRMDEKSEDITEDNVLEKEAVEMEGYIFNMD